MLSILPRAIHFFPHKRTGQNVFLWSSKPILQSEDSHQLVLSDRKLDHLNQIFSQIMAIYKTYLTCKVSSESARVQEGFA